MTDASSPRGFGILCKPSGVIERFVRDDLGLRKTHNGKHFKELLDSGSRVKAQAFLDALRYSGAAFGWDLDVHVDRTVKTMYFIGGTTGEICLICGVSSPATAWPYLDELTRINSEQALHVRDVIKQVFDARMQPGSSSDLLEDLSRLNNELLNVQRELFRRNNQLKQLNDEKNRAMGMVAHDLRNPINIFHMYSTYLLQVMDDRLDDEEREFLSTMQGTARSMSRLVNDILDVAAIESGQLKLNRSSLDIAQLIESIVQRQRSLARESGVDIELRSAADSLPNVEADAGKLEQVVINLLDNAVKFSPARGVVEVLIGRDADHITLHVHDSGPGVAPDIVKTLFQPFGATQSSTAQGKTGTGLGLSIARRIVEAHHGSIELVDAGGAGATFRVRLPFRHTPSSEAHNGQTILV